MGKVPSSMAKIQTGNSGVAVVGAPITKRTKKRDKRYEPKGPSQRG